MPIVIYTICRLLGCVFFTVYGPWGRPDMAYFKFVEAIAQNRPIDVYNHGQMRRDFTYIDDVIEGITRVMKKPQPKLTASTASTVSTAEAAEAARAQSADTTAPYKIYNIGNHSPVTLMDFITTIEQAMGKTAQKKHAAHAARRCARHLCRCASADGRCGL